MKFPYKLSKERLSILSAEDRAIYEYEHSGLCPEMNQLIERKKVIKNDNGEVVPEYCECGGKVCCMIKGEPVYVCSVCGKYYGTMPFTHESIDSDNLVPEDLNEIDLPNDYSESEKAEIKRMLDEMLFESQFDELFDKQLIEEVGLDEYNNIKTQIFEYILNDPELKALNEAEGRSMDWWMDCSWIIKLGAGLLTGLLGIIAWLYMKGKDRLAMLKLKQYMNKLVELTDQGVNKKRPWYSFLMIGRKAKQNTGDYNKACFRTILETAERNMACLYTLAITNLGFLHTGISTFNRITSGDVPDSGSGIGKFYDIVNGLSDEADNIYDGNNKILPYKLNKQYFEDLKLPPLPTNYGMLMSNIDYPTKANKNPNGSLFMQPTKEILQAKGSNIGSAYFNDDVNVHSIITYAKNESFYNPLLMNNSAYMALLEVEDKDNGLDKTTGAELNNILTGDINPTGVAGADLEQEIEKREETKVSNYKGDIIHAIDNYVRATVPIVMQLCRSVCGKSAANEIKELTKLINQLNNAADGNLTKFLKEKDTVLQTVCKNEYQRIADKQRTQVDVLQNIIRVQQMLSNTEFVKKLGIDNKKLNALSNAIQKLCADSDVNEKDLNRIIKTYTSVDYNDFKIAYKKVASKHADDTDESAFGHVSYNHSQELYEDEQVKDAKEIMTELEKQIDSVYNAVSHMLTEHISPIVENDPADWYIITNARDRMKKLKEACDKEITAKIELICRTANSATTDLGTKFKAALSKHPVRAASLTNIWARYSDDLEDRIESRIRSITGDNGNSNILNTIKTFLTVTYPNLIAMMCYYKQAFTLIQLYTKKHPVTKESIDVIDKQRRQEDTYRMMIQLQGLENKYQK